MQVSIISESGMNAALLGLGLSYGVTSKMDADAFKNPNITTVVNMKKVADRLAGKGLGHDKFLRCIIVIMDIKAPRFWWSEFDTYKVGTTALSESTMHTLGKRKLTNEDFEYPLPDEILRMVNDKVSDPRLTIAEKKSILPEGFLQRRVVMMNYAVLANILAQRANHRLPQWQYFVKTVKDTITFPEFLMDRRSGNASNM